MQVNDILVPERTLAQVEGVSKKRVLEIISNLIAISQPNLSSRDIFESLVARERLGSTGLGHGVAIPHSRLEHLEQPLGALVVLSQPINFDTLDGEPVDIFFGLFVPKEGTQDHLELLSQLAELLSDESVRKKMRLANSDEQLYEIAKRHPSF